jgi:Na+-transporting NADH:ubiquinone oxidoreductase subunit A
MQSEIYKIKKGIQLNLIGEAQKAVKLMPATPCAINPPDFRWLVPKLIVDEGDCVKVGTPLFCNKNDESIRIVSPVSGTVCKIVRGEKRKLEHIVITSDGKSTCEDITIKEDNREDIIETLLVSGLWTFILQRPFAAIANPADMPKAVFVSCFDSAPLAPDYSFILKDKAKEFAKGIEIISKLTIGKTFLCLKADSDNSIFEDIATVEKCYFSGPHPSGNIGTQIHTIAPLGKGEVIWYANPQDIATIGNLFLNGKLDFSKTIAVCGESIENPCYLKLINGASLSPTLTKTTKGYKLNNTDEPTFDTVIKDTYTRIISGNILTGKAITDECFLRYYDNQVTLIPEGGKRELFGWLMPGINKWSLSHTYLSWLFKHKKYSLDTSLHGGRRSMVVSDVYEKVFPFSILPIELLKACEIKDIEFMEELGIYEVVEEDFATCELVCPSKTECQQIIYEGLSLLRK